MATIEISPEAKSHYAYGVDLPKGRRAIAPYAASAVPSRGRLHEEAACPTRTDVQRDRDRIIHASAFRRLMFKTQMFIFHEGDHYRTRLTHSLEVAQIARTIARQLCLDEDLAEAIALAHDLGHPPFGHAGERALDTALEDVGGFDHNVQSMRVVTELERKYARFDGLNLSWETLEGLVKHNGPPARGVHHGDAAMMRALDEWPVRLDLQLDGQASAEAQVAALADDIAWRTHDIDDGLRAGLITMADLEDVALVRPILETLQLRANRDPSRDIYEIVRQLITQLVTDVVGESRRRLAALDPVTPDDIRAASSPVVWISAEIEQELADLRTFLFAALYRHPRIMAVMNDAAGVISDLVERFRADMTVLPLAWRDTAHNLPADRRLRLIGDYVAGMTDRYAISEHRRLFDVTPELR